jgi:DNA-binding MarR family transcriptional regulator
MDPAPARATAEATADDILSDVHVLANLIGRTFSGQLEDTFGMSVPEWRVLLTLARHPGFTAAEITNRWAMDKMAISRAIQRLEGDGHISRDRNPSDRRSYRLNLTASGNALYQKILPAANKRYHEVVSCLTRDELSSLRGSLEKLITHADGLRG